MNNSTYMKYNTLSKLIYKQIKNNILSSKYKSGEKLLLQKLSDEMNVSITPIRDALNKLKTEGVVKIIPNKGAMIETFTFRDLIEIYDIRKQFEGLAITYISNMENNKSILSELYEICKKDLDVLEKNDIKSHVKYINSFHNTLVRSTGSKRLIKFYNEIYLQSSFLVQNTIKFTRNPRKSNIEHKSIVKAIGGGKNINHALELLNCHIENVKNDILKEVMRLFKKKNIPFSLDKRIDLVE